MSNEPRMYINLIKDYIRLLHSVYNWPIIAILRTICDEWGILIKEIEE